MDVIGTAEKADYRIHTFWLALILEVPQSRSAYQSEQEMLSQWETAEWVPCS
jgi:hypothetical protein